MASDTQGAPRQHASTGPASPQLPEPGFAERVRTLFTMSAVGTLSTLSRRQPGFPFGSLMPYALDAEGRPLFLISNMAMHTQNLKADGRASLFVTQPATDSDVLGASRATLVGHVSAVPQEELNAAREVYLLQHESSRYWVDFADFGFFRLQPLEVYYVGGFGVMGWVEAGEYAGSQADPLWDAAAGILAHMNADHGDSLILLARHHAGYSASEATMTAVDRLGFSVRLKTAEGMKGARINFLREVRSPGETRAALVEMVQAARKHDAGL